MSLQISTLAQLLHARADASPSGVAIRTKGNGSWEDRTWAQVRDRADRIAAGLDIDPRISVEKLEKQRAAKAAAERAKPSARRSRRESRTP